MTFDNSKRMAALKDVLKEQKKKKKPSSGHSRRSKKSTGSSTHSTGSNSNTTPQRRALEHRNSSETLTSIESFHSSGWNSSAHSIVESYQEGASVPLCVKQVVLVERSWAKAQASSTEWPQPLVDALQEHVGDPTVAQQVASLLGDLAQDIVQPDVEVADLEPYVPLFDTLLTQECEINSASQVVSQIILPALTTVLVVPNGSSSLEQVKDAWSGVLTPLFQVMESSSLSSSL